MKVIRFEELSDFLPPGHSGVVNRLLVGRENGDDGSVSVWHGTLEPGGCSDVHVHEGSLQIYVGLVGEMTVGDGERAETLDRMTTAVFEKGTRHSIANHADERAEVLVISVPALR